MVYSVRMIFTDRIIKRTVISTIFVKGEHKSDLAPFSAEWFARTVHYELEGVR
jgi:hypothetical protein